MIVILSAKFIEYFTGHVFKIIPLKEDEVSGEDVHLSEYIDSVVIEATGALATFKELANDTDFLTVVNILNYLNNNEVSEGVCKRETFKMLGLLNAIALRMGGETNA